MQSITRLLSKTLTAFSASALTVLQKLDDITLCSVFANTLDNAIEACSRIPTPTAWESPPFRKL